MPTHCTFDGLSIVQRSFDHPSNDHNECSTRGRDSDTRLCILCKWNDLSSSIKHHQVNYLRWLQPLFTLVMPFKVNFKWSFIFTGHSIILHEWICIETSLTRQLSEQNCKTGTRWVKLLCVVIATLASNRWFGSYYYYYEWRKEKKFFSPFFSSSSKCCIIECAVWVMSNGLVMGHKANKEATNSLCIHKAHLFKTQVRLFTRIKRTHLLYFVSLIKVQRT